jgi:hypothetical protein
MNIDKHSTVGPGQVSHGTQAIVSLDRRLELQRAGTTTDPSPEFDQFYDAFMKWMAESVVPSSNGIQLYLKQYTNADGVEPYRTTQKQMDVLTQAMRQMKDQGLESGADYKEIKVALISISSANMFVQEFMQDVFKPSEDEDDRENSSW